MANKEKKKIQLGVFDLPSYAPQEVKQELFKGKSWYTYGEDNKYPQYVYNTYSNCATLQSIINGSAEYTFGDGIKINGQLPMSFKDENVDGDTLEDVIQKLILDLWIFGGFAVQVQYNQLGGITELIYVDFRYVRTDKKANNIFYYDKWGEHGQGTKAIYFPCFDPEKGKEDGSQIFYYKGKGTRGVYPLPEYEASLISAETQIEINEFHYNSIINNFMVNGILSFNNAGNVEDDIKDRTEEDINNKFSGTKNAARLMVVWNEGKEKGLEFTRITDDNFDKKFQQLSEDVRQNIFISLRAMPVLFGLPNITGFADQDYESAFRFYNRTAIKPKQKEVTRVLDKILGKGIITIKPFTFGDEEVVDETES